MAATRAGSMLCVSALALMGSASGCRSDFRTPDDGLRRTVLEQKNRIAQLEAEVTRRKAAAVAREREIARLSTPPHAAQAAGVEEAVGSIEDGVEVPRLAGLRYDGWSGPDDRDGDGVAEVVRLFVQPIDQLGRMRPVAARVTAKLVRVGGETLWERTLSPAEWDAAYRTGFTGPYYAVNVPLEGAVAEAGLEGLAVRVELVEAVTGVRVGTTLPLD